MAPCAIAGMQCNKHQRAHDVMVKERPANTTSNELRSLQNDAGGGQHTLSPWLLPLSFPAVISGVGIVGWLVLI